MRPTGLRRSKKIRELLVDDGHLGRAGGIPTAEVTAREHCRLQGTEVPRTDTVEPRQLAVTRSAAALAVNGVVPTVPAERAEDHLRHALHPRLPGDPFLHLIEHDTAMFGAQSGKPRVDSGDEDTFGRDAGIDAQEVAQRLTKEQGTDEQDERQRDLRHDQ